MNIQSSSQSWELLVLFKNGGMLMYYVKSIGQAISTCLSRKNSNIRSSVESFIEKRYGIKDFYAELDKYLVPQSIPTAFLARQVHSLNVEVITHEAFCRKHGVPIVHGTFLQDSFNSMSHDKRSRVHVPWCTMSKKGSRVVKKEKLNAEAFIDLEGRTLMSIKTLGGRSLQDWHRDIVTTALGQTQVIDVSAFYMKCVELSANKPEFVYVENVDGYVTKQAYTPGITKMRPPAKWYYPIYFSMFMDGSYMLFETYENPEFGVSKAKENFMDTLTLIEKECGNKPIVVETLPLSTEMTYHLQVFRNDPSMFKEYLNTLCAFGSDESVQDVLASYSQAAIGYT